MKKLGSLPLDALAFELSGNSATNSSITINFCQVFASLVMYKNCDSNLLKSKPYILITIGNLKGQPHEDKHCTLYVYTICMTTKYSP